jgi:DNA ligase-1
MKAKKEAGSIDAVIRYATGGTGRRSGTLSDFTFGVWLEMEDGTRKLVNIGKAYGGYSNEELAELNRRLAPLRRERFGSTYAIEPEIVCELVYDFIQENPRSEAGYTLRFPRIRRIRWDLALDDIDTVADVARLYREDLERGGAAEAGVYVP